MSLRQRHSGWEWRQRTFGDGPPARPCKLKAETTVVTRAATGKKQDAGLVLPSVTTGVARGAVGDSDDLT